MSRNYFSDVNTPRVYTSGGGQDAVYGGFGGARVTQQVVGPQVVGAPAGGPWWAQGVSERVEYQPVQGDVRYVNSRQLSAQDRAVYQDYLVNHPWDVIVADDRDRQSNGKKRKMDYSGYWRSIGDPYTYSEQPQVAYVDPRPAPRAFVTEEVAYNPYGAYQTVVPPPQPVGVREVRQVLRGGGVYGNRM